VVNNNGIYGGLDDDVYKDITGDGQPSSITRWRLRFLKKKHSTQIYIYQQYK
jgi:hypothetical protein